MKTFTSDKYPSWICMDCGNTYGNRGCGRGATFHMDECGVCGEYKEVTEPRDFGHIRFQEADWAEQMYEPEKKVKLKQEHIKGIEKKALLIN